MTVQRITPNMIVADMDAAVAFYRDVLGFTLSQTVPEQPPYIFAWFERDGHPVFLNDAAVVRGEAPELEGFAVGGSSLYLVVDAVDELFSAVEGRARVVMSLRTQPYGMREFSVLDPAGNLLTFAQETRAA